MKKWILGAAAAALLPVVYPNRIFLLSFITK